MSAARVARAPRAFLRAPRPKYTFSAKFSCLLRAARAQNSCWNTATLKPTTIFNWRMLSYNLLYSGGDGTQSFSRNWIVIPSHHMIWYLDTQLTDIYYTLLYYIVLNFAMVEMAPNPFQEDGFGIPSQYDTILYSIDVYYPIIYCAMVEMAPNPFQESGFDIPSQYMIWYLDSQLTYNLLYSAVSYCIVFCNGGDGTQSFSRRWIWHPISQYVIILYSIDVYYAIVMGSIFLTGIGRHSHHCRI